MNEDAGESETTVSRALNVCPLINEASESHGYRDQRKRCYKHTVAKL